MAEHDASRPRRRVAGTGRQEQCVRACRSFLAQRQRQRVHVGRSFLAQRQRQRVHVGRSVCNVVQVQRVNSVLIHPFYHCGVKANEHALALYSAGGKTACWS